MSRSIRYTKGQNRDKHVAQLRRRQLIIIAVRRADYLDSMDERYPDERYGVPHTMRSRSAA